MSPLEPDSRTSGQSYSTDSLITTAKNFWDEMITFLLLILTVTIVFIASVLAGVLTLWIINETFGSAVRQNSVAEQILESFQFLSAIGTVIAYIITIVFLIFRILILPNLPKFLRNFLHVSWEKQEQDDSLKTKMKRWLHETIRPLLTIITSTIIFISLIGALALAFWVTSLVIPPSFVNFARIFAAFGIALAYVLKIGRAHV